MDQIHPVFIDPKSVAASWQTTVPKAVSNSDQETETETSLRSVHDTVELSDSANKIINLARGQDLAAETQSKTVDEGFAFDLKKALEDIFRVTRLFSETVKAAFQSKT